MAVNKQMYDELYRLRATIKNTRKTAEGRTPLVCTDEALEEIAELCPKKLSDFEGITGIGKTFIENYGEEFLNVILKYESVPAEKTVPIKPEVAKTLKELEKKLVSINRRNRLLYMAKTAGKYSFDLYTSGPAVAENIIFTGKKVTVCNIANLDERPQSDEEWQIYRKIVQILREVNKDLRDKGQNDLYIGYPFVIGKLTGEDFDVRAPLALFPVTAERTAGKITVQLDDTRDVIYNTTLILANFKFNGITKPLPDDDVDDISCESFITSLLEFYKENGLAIEDGDRMMKKFTEYKADEFPKLVPGRLCLEPCAVLGKFPIRSSSVQKDFDRIILSNRINTLLNDLLINSGEIDIYAESEPEVQKQGDFDLDREISEKDLTYINSLNSSQEAVLCAAEQLDELVMQGPPGTGKSQTITGLISEFVNNDKTVLMVSEKKTALDVVYSRLGTLSQYALLIDDVSNKDQFYKQLSKMVGFGNVTQGTPESTDKLSEDIDSDVQRLRTIADKLYSYDEQLGTEPYKMYLVSRKPDLTNEEQKSRTRLIAQKRDALLSGVKYPALYEARNVFSNEKNGERLQSYIEANTEYPWLSSFKPDMTEFDTIELEAALETVKNEAAAWKAKNIFIRLFTKGKVKKAANEVISRYFTKGGKTERELLISNAEAVQKSTGSYLAYRDNKQLYDTLSDEQKIYLKSVLDVKNGLSCAFTVANAELFNHLMYERIGQFEAQNRELIRSIDEFDTIIEKLSAEIDQKQKITRSRLDRILSGELNGITASKRHGEILRVLESKRKWSVAKFIRKFDFELFRSVKIWLLTPEVVSEIIPLQTGIFDLVVFDEASQMYVEKGLPSILRGKKVVIAGDHKQLRPSALGQGRLEIDDSELGEDEEVNAALEEESLLDLARFKYKDVVLNFHYRSKYEELIAFSNYAFYGGRLYVSPNTETPKRPPIEVHKTENAVWENRTNMAEAQYIVTLLKQFFKERSENETVGIIAFNSNQRDLIDDLIDEECARDAEFAAAVTAEVARRKDGEDIGMFVKNVESVQGDERDVIIFSIGYAKNEKGKLVRNFGWLNQRGGENRLNVAVSRAKKKVHIVVSFNPSELETDDMKNDGPRILKKYLEYAFAISNGDKQTARSVLLSFTDGKDKAAATELSGELEAEIRSALVQRGYEVDSNVGIGGYSIDLAVKRDGRYILGIECDSKLYEGCKKARERDYHRKKYLEARGWRVYRMWSSNWWKNPAGELEKLCRLLGE